MHWAVVVVLVVGLVVVGVLAALGAIDPDNAGRLVFALVALGVVERRRPSGLAVATAYLTGEIGASAVDAGRAAASALGVIGG